MVHEKWSLQWRDSNPQPFSHESSALTTRPRRLAFSLNVFTFFSLLPFKKIIKPICFTFRYTTGEVKGKYGYYDDTGKLREVEYGASPKSGFNPSGEGLVVPPAAPVQSVQVAQPVQPESESVEVNGRRASVVRRPRPEGSSDRRIDVQVRRNKQPAQPAFQPAPQPAAPAFQRAQPAFQPAAPAFQPIQPVLTNAERFAGHPASNIDLSNGSYSVHYSGR